MTNYISLDRSKTPKYYILPLFVVKKLCRSSNRLIYAKSAPQNIYTITGALTFDTSMTLELLVLSKKKSDLI